MAINSNVCSHFFTFVLMTTGAFSQSVGKLFSEFKLVTDDLSNSANIMPSLSIRVVPIPQFAYTADKQ